MEYSFSGDRVIVLESPHRTRLFSLTKFIAIFVTEVSGKPTGIETESGKQCDSK